MLTPRRLAIRRAVSSRRVVLASNKCRCGLRRAGVEGRFRRVFHVKLYAVGSVFTAQLCCNGANRFGEDAVSRIRKARGDLERTCEVHLIEFVKCERADLQVLVRRDHVRLIPKGWRAGNASIGCKCIEEGYRAKRAQSCADKVQPAPFDDEYAGLAVGLNGIRRQQCVVRRPDNEKCPWPWREHKQRADEEGGLARLPPAIMPRRKASNARRAC